MSDEETSLNVFSKKEGAGNNEGEWKTTKVEKLLDELLSGGRPTGGGLDEGKYISIGGTQVNSMGHLNLEDLVYIPESYFEKVSDTQLKKHDILMVKDGANTGDVAIAWESDERIVTNEHLFTLRPKSEINSPYLFYYLLSHRGWRQINGTITGSAQEGINRGFTGKVDVEYPPLPEQQKIATILYTVDQAIQKTEDIVQQTKQVQESVKNELFTTGYTDAELKDSSEWRSKAKQFPRGWEVKPAEELMEITRGASPRPRSDDSLFGGDIPWIKIGDAERGESKRIESVDSYVTEKGKEKSKFVQEDTLLVANSGATCGFSVFAGVDGCVHDGWLILREYDRFNPDFLHHYINWNYGYLQSLSLGSAQTNLSTSLFGRLDVPIPPIEEQNNIVDTLDSIGSVISQNKRELEPLYRLKKGLMQDLLSEAVRTTDTNIEVPDKIERYG